MPSGDFAFQLDLVLRLLAAALLGAAVGLEREFHDHPAGTRTHLLVAMGAALFTVLSAHGFGGPGVNVDPTRIAAQIVTGIGFLGAGAIIHYGTSVRGLTTAASLWATAAIGLAAGAGLYLLAAITTAVVVVSLGPLNRIVSAVRPQAARTMQVRLALDDLEAMGRISAIFLQQHVEMTAIESRRIRGSHYEVELRLKLPVGFSSPALAQALSGVKDVSILEASDILD
ncbi:MAG: MgtC/SapB family protein [Candidatus Limnocylindrales bacterium]